MKIRLDAELVRRELARSREQASDLIEARSVLVNGIPATKPATMVDAETSIKLHGKRDDFVSRGGHKLAGALDAFSGVVVEGKRCLDAGASTGGFTDCVLQRGATHVVALDVGHGQLHPKIRDDERVTVMERFNVRDMTIDDIGGEVDVVVADLSFISLTLVVPALIGVCRPGSELVLLVKPQFEVGRRDVSKGKGIISDPELHQVACDGVRESCENAGATVNQIISSPITGAEGNKEFLLYATVREKISV